MVIKKIMNFLYKITIIITKLIYKIKKYNNKN